MALLHRADVRPTKVELLTGWLPGRPWYRGPAAPEFRRVDSFRFDDPQGRVGIETLLVQAGDGPVLQAPLTYRDAPLAGQEQWLLGTMEHSVLGRRWVYDGCGDPVYAATLAATIAGAAGQAEEFVDIDGQLQRREPTAAVQGSGATFGPVTSVVRVEDGDPTVIVTDTVELRVVRILADPPESGPVLAGTWKGQETPLVLVHAESPN